MRSFIKFRVRGTDGVSTKYGTMREIDFRSNQGEPIEKKNLRSLGFVDFVYKLFKTVFRNFTSVLDQALKYIRRN